MDTDHDIEKEATIPSYPSVETTKPSFIEVKYTISASSFKMELTILKGGCAEEFLLRSLYEFNNAKFKLLGYTNYQKLESGIEHLLPNTSKDEWTTIKGTVQAGTNTLQSFEDNVEAF